MNETKAVVAADKKDVTIVEYVPFGASDKIKLSVAIVQNLIAVPTKSGKTCSQRDALKFLAMVQAKRLNPFEGDAYLIGYDAQDGPIFSLITAHQIYLKRAELHQEYDGMESGAIVRDENHALQEIHGDFVDDGLQLVGGWCKVHFKTRKYPMYKRLKLSRFDKGRSVWRDDPAGMIVKCFDPETEILTTRGFEKFAKAEGRVLQVGDTGLEPTDAVPFVQYYTGPMVSLLSDDLNFMVTPNHDMLTDAGRIEADQLFKQSRSRDKFSIPRTVSGTKNDADIGYGRIVLAAAYLADGSDKPDCSFWISVSREQKIAKLEHLGLHHAKHLRECAGDTAESAGRVITTHRDKQVFGYKYDLIEPLAKRGKRPVIEGILSLSKEQARWFVDALIEFDGSRNALTGVRRFYSSNPEIMQAFEVAAVVAGYSVSNRKQRESDIGTKPNFDVTVSDRHWIGVHRWGDETKPGLVMRPNESGKVWCVKVPSGAIVVRRQGFSMLCGNCAEADALRSSFPTMLGGLYMREELEVRAPELARPDFSAPSAAPTPLFTLPPAGENGNKAPEAPPAEQAPAGDPPAAFDEEVAVRNLCSQANVTPRELLAWLESSGLTDGSESSLGEVKKLVLKTVNDRWAEVKKAIEAARAGKGGTLI